MVKPRSFVQLSRDDGKLRRLEHEKLVPRAELCGGYVANTPASTLEAAYQRMSPRLSIVHVENKLPDKLKRKAMCMTSAEVGVEPAKHFRAVLRTVLSAPTRTAVVGTSVATESAAVARLVACSRSGP